MAAPSYTTDLQLIYACEDATGWDESSDAAWDDGGLPAQEADYYIQGDYCVSSALKTGRGTMIYDYGSEITFAAGDVFMAWLYCIGPTAMANYADGGFGLLIGDGLGDFYNWDVWGKDYYIYGGWICVPVDPTQTVSDTVGSPSGVKQFFGMSANITGNIQKGNTIGIDVMRYGRAEAIFKYGDAANGYCNFAGFVAVNDNTSNRWGLLQAVPGGYLWQGLMSFGVAGSGGDAVDFRDSNRLIFVAQQLKVYSSFNRIEINQSDSRVDWTNVVFVAIGGVSIGELEVMDNADVNIDGCAFIDMGTFDFLANSTIQDTNFVRCGKVTQGGGTIDGCVFNKTTDAVALDVDDVSKVTNCEFISTGQTSTGHHAIEGFSSAGNYGLTGLTFTDYADEDGDTGAEAIHVLATSGTVTLTLSGGTTPSIRTEGATVDIVSGAVDVTVTVKTSAGVNIQNARVIVEAADGAGPFPYQEAVTIVNADDSGGPTAYVTHNNHGLATNDYVNIEGASYSVNNGVHQITVTGANTYTYELSSYPGANPSGTITCTFVALYGLSNVNGVVTTSRVYSANQNVAGHARKSTSTPFYKTGVIVGEVDKDDGFSTTAIMILDE